MKPIQYIKGQKVSGVIYLGDTVSHITKSGRKQRTAFFKCHCGEVFKCKIEHIKNGSTKSCGCLNHPKGKDNPNYKHGLYGSDLYNVWKGMKQRCNDKNHISYKNYGGKGIKVCARWDRSYQEFYDWSMTNGYKKGLTIDRKDNDGNYTPDNCRFVTNAENIRNSRAAKLNWNKIKEIRKSNLPKKYLASTYGVTASQIYRIKNNQSWKI